MTAPRSPNDLQSEIGYRFKDADLLDRALTHASFAEGVKRKPDNERLEFLGDRVLGLLTAEWLLERFPDATEGDLARSLNQMVNRRTCARVGKVFDLGAYIKLSKSEARNGGRTKASIIGNAVEALLGAMYLDGGLDQVRPFYRRVWADIDVGTGRDPKTGLQEWAQAKGLPVPTYDIVDRSGPDHAPVFTVAVSVKGYMPFKADGQNKQTAEREAAKTALKSLDPNGQ